MDLSKKLTALCKPNDVLRLQDLVGKGDFLITGARQVTTRHGKAVVVDLSSNDQDGSLFLPKRFTDSLDEEDLHKLVLDKYKLKITQEGTAAPNVVIFLKKK